MLRRGVPNYTTGQFITLPLFPCATVELAGISQSVLSFFISFMHYTIPPTLRLEHTSDFILLFSVRVIFLCPLCLNI